MTATLKTKPRGTNAESARHRRRRAQRFQRTLTVYHRVLPGLEVARQEARVGETVTAFLRRTGWAKRHPKHGWQFSNRLPTILQIDGRDVMRSSWRNSRLRAGSVVNFVSRPLGGQGSGSGSSGKSVIGIISLVAVAALAGWLGPMIGGALPGVFGGFGSALATGVIPSVGGLGLIDLKPQERLV